MRCGAFGGQGGQPRYFRQLSATEQESLLMARLKKYCQKVYKRVLDKPIEDKREAGICMRENSFYIDTVRSFRDRRYEYKGLNKKWGAKLREATAAKNPIAIQEVRFKPVGLMYTGLSSAESDFKHLPDRAAFGGDELERGG
jgi:DNA polymerase epsilon subunit 1